MRSDIPPDTVEVELVDGGITVEYADGRETFYHGVPEPVEDSIRTPPEKEVHVLVTDQNETEGVLTYVNDRKTHDDILQESGVGRVILEDDEETELFPGVTAAVDGHAVVVRADHDVVEGRVFVFAEDPMSEYRYELVPEH
ncbi:MAG: hypothetical protein ACI8VE_003111 [Natrialbaceae archaeon]|jgi:hypothetical protein